MHPLSTLLFILGYALALPLAGRLPAIIAGRQRLAFAGHQVGILVALLGWLVRGSFVMATIHTVWLVATRIWYGMAERKQRDITAAAANR